jgi:hypothetical protein
MILIHGITREPATGIAHAKYQHRFAAGNGSLHGINVDITNSDHGDATYLIDNRDKVNYPAHRAGHLKNLNEGDCIPPTPAPHSSPSTGRGILRRIS